MCNFLHLAFSVFASERQEDTTDDGFYMDLYLSGGIVHQNKFATGLGTSLNLRYADLSYGVYLDLKYSFYSPDDYAAELFVEPGVQVAWDFFKRENNITSLSLGFGFAMDTGIMVSSDGIKANIYPYALVVKPMITTNLKMRGDYYIGLGLYYQAAAFPASTSSVFNGFGLVVKVL